MATSNVLLGNYIGIDVTGTFPIGNLGNGVSISTGRNQIGDASYAGDNVISGNTGDGLVIQARSRPKTPSSGTPSVPAARTTTSRSATPATGSRLPRGLGHHDRECGHQRQRPPRHRDQR